MILMRAPLRISFIGGGTDYFDWFFKNRGEVLSVSIDRYVYVLLGELSPIWNTKYKFSYSQMEEVNHISQIKHPLIRSCVAKYSNPEARLSIQYASDLPGNSGLGSSSAFCASLIQGLKLLCNSTPATKSQLAKEAIFMEREVMNEAGGWQDQIASVYGGFNSIVFEKSEFAVTPLDNSFIKSYLEECVLIHVGQLRKSQDLALEQVKQITRKTEMYTQLLELVTLAKKAISTGDKDLFSNVIDESWELKSVCPLKYRTRKLITWLIKSSQLAVLVLNCWEQEVEVFFWCVFQVG